MNCEALGLGQFDLDLAAAVAGLEGVEADHVTTFMLAVQSSCGNDVVDPGEQCDDGNRIDGDGCDSNCTPTGCGNGQVTVNELITLVNIALGDAEVSQCDTGTRCCAAGPRSIASKEGERGQEPSRKGS